MAAMVEIENLSRSKLILPLYDDKGGIRERVVIGDAADRSEFKEGEPGHPVQRFTQTRWKEIHGVHGKFLKGLASKRDIVVRGADL